MGKRTLINFGASIYRRLWLYFSKQSGNFCNPHADPFSSVTIFSTLAAVDSGRPRRLDGVDGVFLRGGAIEDRDGSGHGGADWRSGWRSGGE